MTLKKDMHRFGLFNKQVELLLVDLHHNWEAQIVKAFFSKNPECTNFYYTFRRLYLQHTDYFNSHDIRFIDTLDQENAFIKSDLRLIYSSLNTQQKAKLWEDASVLATIVTQDAGRTLQ
jgi:hypothetical protein